MGRKSIFKKTNGKCFYCGQSIDYNNFHADHFLSKKNGGVNREYNLVPSCCNCNLYKGELSIEDFRNKLENLHNNFTVVKLAKSYYNFSHKDIIFYFEEINFEVGEYNG